MDTSEDQECVHPDCVNCFAVTLPMIVLENYFALCNARLGCATVLHEKQSMVTIGHWIINWENPTKSPVTTNHSDRSLSPEIEKY